MDAKSKLRKEMRSNSKKLILAFSMLAIAIAFTGSAFAADKMAADKHTSTKFEGPKANAGTVTHSKKDGKNVLTLSEDFVVPDTPDPHWQIVDSKGTVYLLDRLKLKGDKIQTSITLPAYVKDVAKVQIWCAFAEANLGEASFATPVK
jgi:uncharacterized protein YdeI (BOF family)